MAVLEYPSWKTLTRHARAAKQYSMKRLFNDDPKRASRFSIEVAGLYLDYSKNLIDDQTLQIFSDITDEAGVFESIKQMTGGARINSTENRAALHTLLRTPSSAIPDGLASKADQVFDSLDRMKKISDALRQGGWHGHSNRPIKHVVHLGIGGSYLGPRMIDESLMAQPAADISLHYIANVDAQHISQVLSKLDPDETLVIVVSKTFNTLETITNAETAREWLLTNMEKDDLSHHLVAITANTDAALRFGVDTNNILPIWDWVGGLVCG